MRNDDKENGFILNLSSQWDFTRVSASVDPQVSGDQVLFKDKT